MSTKLVDTECPGCHKKFGTAVNLDEIVIGQVHKEREHEPLPDIGAMIDQKLKEREPKEAPKEKKEIKVKLPRTQPKWYCTGKGCEGHDNEDYSERPYKRCTKCNRWGGSKDVTTCPMCGNNDPDDFEIDDDETLDDLNIPRPKAHDHGDHE